MLNVAGDCYQKSEIVDAKDNKCMKPEFPQLFGNLSFRKRAASLISGNAVTSKDLSKVHRLALWALAIAISSKIFLQQ